MRTTILFTCLGLFVGILLVKQGFLGRVLPYGFPKCFTRYDESTSNGLKIGISGKLRPQGNIYEKNECTSVEFEFSVGHIPSLRLVSSGPLTDDLWLLWIGPIVEYEVQEITESYIRSKPMGIVDRTLTIDRKHGHLIVQEKNETGEDKGILTFKLDGKEQVLDN